jgi:hypothetical protein
MLSSEYQALVAWLKAPFTTNVPMWQLMLTFAVFVILGFIVVDNLDLIKKGIEL